MKKIDFVLFLLKKDEKVEKFPIFYKKKQKMVKFLTFYVFFNNFYVFAKIYKIIFLL